MQSLAVISCGHGTTVFLSVVTDGVRRSASWRSCGIVLTELGGAIPLLAETDDQYCEDGLLTMVCHIGYRMDRYIQATVYADGKDANLRTFPKAFQYFLCFWCTFGAFVSYLFSMRHMTLH